MLYVPRMSAVCNYSLCSLSCALYLVGFRLLRKASKSASVIGAAVSATVAVAAAGVVVVGTEGPVVAAGTAMWGVGVGTGVGVMDIEPNNKSMSFADVVAVAGVGAV